VDRWYLYSTENSYFMFPTDTVQGGVIVAAGSRIACDAAYRLFDPAGWEIHGCIINPCEVLEDLLRAEKQLAERFNLSGSNIRAQLIQKDLDDDLQEDELVADWHDLLTMHRNIG